MNSTNSSDIRTFIEARATKIMGVVIALFLIVINLYVGLFMATLVTNAREISIEEGISLPIIRKSEYDRAKTDIVSRKSKQLQYFPEEVDPFGT